PLARLEPTQNVIRRVPAVARRADANPESRVLGGPERLLDAPQPVLPAVRAFRTHPQFSERQGDVVANNQGVRQIQLVEVHRRPDRTAAQVHERLGFHQQDLFGPLHRLRDLRLEPAPPTRHARGRGEVVEYRVTDVVPRRVVFRTGVAQAHHQLHTEVQVSSSKFQVRIGWSTWNFELGTWNKDGHSSSSAGFSFFLVMTSGSTTGASVGTAIGVGSGATTCCFTCTTTTSRSAMILTRAATSSSFTWIAWPTRRESIFTRIDSGTAKAGHSTCTWCSGWSRTPPELVPGATPLSSRSTVVRMRSSLETRRKSTCM